MHRPKPFRRVALVAGIALVVGSCSLLPGLPGGDEVPLTIENGTGLDLVVVVNGRGHDVAHQAGAQLGAGILGPRPWSIEARTAASGRWIASLTAEPGEGRCQDTADGSRSCGGALTLVDLSCGRLVMYVMELTPSLPAPMPDAGEPGDCAP